MTPKAPTIQVHGPWNTIWTGRRPITVLAAADDAERFLAQPSLPPVWADDSGYIAAAEGDQERTYRIHWTMAYLHHPDPQVLLMTLRRHTPPQIVGTQGILDALTWLLMHSNSDVCEAAADLLRKTDPDNLEFVHNVLLSTGVLPSGVDPQAGKRALSLLRQTQAPKQPPSVRAPTSGEEVARYFSVTLDLGHTHVDAVIAASYRKRDGLVEFMDHEGRVVQSWQEKSVIQIRDLTEVRRAEEAERKKAEAEWKRQLEEITRRDAEEKRRASIQATRRSVGRCVMCNQKLTFIHRLRGKDRHTKCTSFNE